MINIKSLNNLKIDEDSISAGIEKISNNSVMELVERSKILDGTEFDSVLDVVKKKGTTIGFSIKLSEETAFEPSITVILNDGENEKLNEAELTDDEKENIFVLLTVLYERERSDSIYDFIGTLYANNVKPLGIETLYRYILKKVDVKLGLNGETTVKFDNGKLFVNSSRNNRCISVIEKFEKIEEKEAIAVLDQIAKGLYKCTGVEAYADKTIKDAIIEINRDMLFKAAEEIYGESLVNEIKNDFGGVFDD